MQAQRLVLLTALAVAIPLAASAQDSNAQDTTKQTTTVTTTRQTTSSVSTDTDEQGLRSYWNASGFVGGDFAESVDGSSVNFGGSIGYLYKGAVGAEFLAGFAPDFRLQNSIVLGSERPQINSYMFNVMGAVPVGRESRFQPFVSAGLGTITLGSNLLNNDDPSAQENTLDPDDARFSGNIGGGFMAFAGNWGIRGDIRYFRAFVGDTPAPTGNLTQDALNSLLPGLDFWRANVGVAVRW